jgi:hypothetical protein
MVMIPVGTLPIVPKTELDRGGIEIGAAKNRIDQPFQALVHAGAMLISTHAKIIDSLLFPNQ